MSQPPYFSIVIPTLNEEKYLPVLLTDLAQQDFELENLEVIVVDASSQDQTVLAAKKFKSQLQLKTVIVPYKNISRQRNTGAKQATGDWVLFMDADNQLPQDFLKNLRKQLQQSPQLDIFTTKFKTEFHKYDWLTDLTNNFFVMAKFLHTPFAMGSMIGIKKEYLKKLQFDQKLTVLEDSQFVQDACQAGLNFKILDLYYTNSARRIEKDGVASFLFKPLILAWQRYILKNQKQLQQTYNMDSGGAYYDD